MAEQKNTERNGSWNEDGFSNDVLSSFRSDEQSGAREQKLDSGSREAGDSGSLSGQSLTYGKDSIITDEQDASKQAGKKPKHFHFIWIPCIFIFIGFYFFLFIAGNHNGDKEDSDDRGITLIRTGRRMYRNRIHYLQKQGFHLKTGITIMRS